MMEFSDDDEDIGKKKRVFIRRIINGFFLINKWIYYIGCIGRLLFKFYFYELFDLYFYYFLEMKFVRGIGSFGREFMYSIME